MLNSKSVMVDVIGKVLSSLPEKTLFDIELQRMGLTLEEIPENLYRFHEALKSAFGKHHFSVESQIIKSLHKNVKEGIYQEKDASLVAIQLIDIFTKEHKKEIAATKKTLNQDSFTMFRFC